ncbi:hypothetical protein Dda_7200 [Drechslerella dactyloides]|uniref:Uncharacterized protein n=1 Tax=Drechslerella dactyloides TaxID=74499 RepID=A0AAD6NHA8_DREDA|nr:hypothetical protein Dda_7200 [Drechslerella dactyloides]
MHLLGCVHNRCLYFVRGARASTEEDADALPGTVWAGLELPAKRTVFSSAWSVATAGRSAQAPSSPVYAPTQHRRWYTQGTIGVSAACLGHPEAGINWHTSCQWIGVVRDKRCLEGVVATNLPNSN